MDRRDVLAAGLAFGSKWCDMSWREVIPARNPPPAPTVATYERGRFRVTVSKPRIAYTSASPSAYAWFAGMNRLTSGAVLLRMNASADQVGIPATGKHILSYDGGQTFDPASAYTVQDSHTTAEPLVQGSDGAWRGGTFAPINYNRPGGDLRKVRCYYQTISADGLSWSTVANNVQINGFPADIGSYGTEVGFSWFGDIVQISSSQWLATAIPTYVAETKVFCECIESTDQGHTWNVVGRVAGNFGDEGFSEPAMIRLINGDLMVVSRTGLNRMGRAYSSDLGRTWSAPVFISPWCKAPRIVRLSNNPDYVITTGYLTPASLWPDGTDPVTGAVPNGYAPAQMGIYLSSDPLATTWPVVDLIAHHNALIGDSSLTYDSINPSTGYTSILEMEPGKLLISYDQAGGAYGSSTRPNRVFVVDATIGRRY